MQKPTQLTLFALPPKAPAPMRTKRYTVLAGTPEAFEVEVDLQGKMVRAVRVLEN